MSRIRFTQDFSGSLPQFKDKLAGEEMEVETHYANALIQRGVAELVDFEAKEEKAKVKTKEEKHDHKTK